MAFLPLFQLEGQFEGDFVVADKIVVDDEDLVAPAEFKQPIELRQQLAGALGSGFPSVERDDVAELALERTSAGELHRHGGILLELEQIKPWEGSLANIILLDAHPADHDEVGPKDVCVEQVLKASVDQP